MTATVDGTRHFSIFELRRCGALTPGASRPWYWRSIRDSKITRIILVEAGDSEIRLIFPYKDTCRKQFIPIERTACPYGGLRAWFRCACGGRVAVLFDAGGGFFCRKCLRLGYACQQVTRRWRSIDRAQTIRMRLGGSPSVLEPFPARPRYMRVAKYEAMRRRALASQAEGLAALERSLARRLS
jgi:hypothetical protein